ncbi:class I SAM-dependent DNA methyltransferase [Daejeonella oryzae]|uniref:class I SAM-dependent DNA methyltransferase n=1 Tax=Daejeonella oryzae TaxID=1122943 RepID=UPI0003FD33D5|nr:TaqI-like C-terminal specificity domain-containing protein [Daejeonella oryzae]
MQLSKLKPKQSLNKAYLKETVLRADIELFKDNFKTFLSNTSTNLNDEEYLKTQVSHLLWDTWYKGKHHINPISKNDLAIHTGKSPSDAIGIIVELKSVGNKTEMLTSEKPNAKAFHELVLYYMRERLETKNNEIKHLIATNINDWYVFDANEFDKKIFRNTAIKKLYELKISDKKDNPWFYNELKDLLNKSVDLLLECTYFNIREFEKFILNQQREDDKRIIPLYKILSPPHLLKLPFANDSNSLQPKFYSELLHLIGLTEIKEGSKKLIQRKKEGQRDAGSLIENTIMQLESLDKLSRMDRPSQYGDNQEERLYNVALELVITWINRILFLKLLEAQLLSYHKGDVAYTFLNKDKIKDFDDLNKLFFRVLAKRNDERSESIRQLFGNVPYLNSSLFEQTEIEHQSLFISALEDNLDLTLLSNSILKDRHTNTRKGSLNTLDYLFEFLNAYNFSSEGKEDIQEDNKTLVNASVLGLIFEKINGYKDGSFFTPGFITMYMCKETIRRAVVQKFNEIKGWDCQAYEDLYDKIQDQAEANTIINSLKICDPAVGSGHFLVSALNEIIAIKHDLRILSDRNGHWLKEYQVEVVNDELMVTADGDPFQYNPLNKESQRVQETLFHEKQTIIENCLFGVDINPNSVKICRLRLWIELLKNAYYKNSVSLNLAENPHSLQVLETLPNIDINIKCGNSLINRFALNSDLKQAFSGSKWKLVDYKEAVVKYKATSDKQQKKDLTKLIDDIKSNFKVKFYANDKENKELNKLRGQLTNLLTANIDLFGKKRSAKEIEIEARRLNLLIAKQEQIIDEIKNNKIYANAFEWRFEFPEVLNDDGDFVGFDAVIGNPPYVRQEEFSDIKDYLKQNYEVFAGTADLLIYFIEKGLSVLKENGQFNFIIANKFMRAGFGKPVRTYLQKYQLESIIDFGDLPVFQEATTYPCILTVKKQKVASPFFALIMTDLHVDDLQIHIQENAFHLHQNTLNKEGWNLEKQETQSLVNKLKKSGKPFDEYVNGNVYRGLLTGLNEAFVIDESIKNQIIAQEPQAGEIIKPFLEGKYVKQYNSLNPNKHLILFQNQQTRSWFGKLKEEEAWIELSSKFPVLCSYLSPFKEKAKARSDQGEYWWELRPCAYYNKFQEIKIIYPNICRRPEFTFDETGVYTNQKCFIIPVPDKYLLGVLNSSVTFFLFRNILPKLRGDFYEPSYVYFKDFPIALPDDETRAEIIRLVEKTILIKQDDSNADIRYLEQKIDQLVYQLYNLTEEEIKIVEGEAR